MSRRALLFSLALHAAVLVMVGSWLASTAPHAGPGDPGAGVPFTESGDGGPLFEVAAGPPPLPPEPEFTPPAPTLESPLPPVGLLTAKTSPIPTPPTLSPIAAAAKTDPAKSARTNRATGAARGSGTASEGAGLVETGPGRGGPGYVPPRFRLRYKPVYPEEARARRLEGTVLLRVSLDARGRVTAATLQLTCGHTILDRAALAAVRSWLFEPARQNGAAIAAQVEIPIRFRFEERTNRA